MPDKSLQELTEESKRHSGKSLEHFKEANEMYEQMKNMPQSSPERGEALNAVLAKDDEAIAEAQKAMAINEEFLDALDNNRKTI